MDFHIAKGYVDGPFGQVHYRHTCGTGPALVMLHQVPNSSAMFSPALPLLATSGIHAVALDTPGYGMSDRPEHLPSIDDYATALTCAIRQLGLGCAALLGHHTGAAIAAEIAARDPSLVNSVIVNGPPVMTRDERAAYSAALEQAPPMAVAPDGSHLQQAWDRRALFTPGWTDLPAMQRGVIQMLLAGETYGYGHRAAFAHDIAEPMARITQPGMILTNTGDDIHYAALRAREIRPDFEYLELTGGTHDIVDEQTVAWCRAVCGFVMRHSGAARAATAVVGIQPAPGGSA